MDSSKLEESNMAEENTSPTPSCIDCNGGSSDCNCMPVSLRKRGDYNLVDGFAIEDSCLDDEEAFCHQEGKKEILSSVNDPASTLQKICTLCESSFNKNWLPNHALRYHNIVLMEPAVVKFVKFILLTFIGIVLMHYFIHAVDWGRDKTFTLKDMVLYDGNIIVVDMLAFL